MLTVNDGSPRQQRRDFLKIGGLALGGLSLADFFSESTLAASAKPLISDKSVVFVFMHGGPSQIETFDPKMTAPAGIASATGEIATSLPGITYGSTFPQLAKWADRTTVVRSFTTGDSRHDIKPIVGSATNGANLGSFYSRVAGPNHPRSGMPTNVALYPRAVDESTMAAIKTFGDFEATGSLGGGFAPFVPSGGGAMRQDMELHLPLARLDDRRQLLSQLDRLRRSVEQVAAASNLDSLKQQAFDTILGGVSDAFDLSQEDPEVVARYDTAPLVRPDAIDKKWKNHPRYADNAKSLGKLMLLARRLCERGCGFVTVTTNFVWDMHADQNNAGVVEGMDYMGRPFDHAIAAFLQDLHDRGLSEKILLVCTGEMGRTPRINNRGGRDHWGRLAPLLLAGGGIEPGQVIGQSTRDVSGPATEPVTMSHLVSTVLRSLIDVGELRVQRGIPADIVRAASADPIPGLS